MSGSTEKWLRVTAELIQDGKPVALSDGSGIAYVTRQVLIDDLSDGAHAALPSMVDRAFEFPGLEQAAPSPFEVSA